MSKVTIVEAVYDGMIARGLATDHEAFEDILMACSCVAEMENPSGVDVLAWVEDRERGTEGALDRMLDQERGPARTAVQVYLDWREYLNKCSKKTMKLTALLTVLVEEGAAAK